MVPLLRTLSGLLLGGLGARLLGLLGRFHVSPNGRPKKLSRRGFTRNAALAASGVVAAEIGAGFLWFYWPNKTGAFGSDITVQASEIPAEVGAPPLRNTPGKFWMVRNEDGLLALYTKCPHLGCTVPYIAEGDPPFQCPCHGSHYDYNGVNVAGPAPRPMDYMPITVDDAGNAVVATGSIETRSGYSPEQATPYNA
jgi:cytochrome b6-f complex iron-sulfur subunit